jgi:hypothetical protein
MSDRIGENYNRYVKTNYSEYNSKQFDQNNFKNAYDENYNKSYSISQEPDIVYDQIEHYLSISSRDRNRTTYPNVNNYIINFPLEFRNIASIELVQAIIPAQNNVDQEPYLLLTIDELPDVMISNDKNIANSFAILQLSSPVTAGGFIQIDKRIHENTVLTFKTPKANLAKMTVSIRDCLGELFDFGNDASLPNAPTKSLQNTFIFKITTLEKRRAQLSHRNVY